MENLTTTTRPTTALHSNLARTKTKPERVRSEESIIKFLMRNKGYEYINGKFVKKMSNAKHSGIATRLSVEIGIFLKKNKIGRVYNEAHFQIGTNKKIPDVAFIIAERIPKEGEPELFWTIAPDLAVEVISPTDFYQNVFNKIDDYFIAGVKQVWIINAHKKMLTIYYSLTDDKVLTINDELVCEEILPNFRLDLREIFID